MTRRTLPLLLILVVGSVFTGCGLGDPYSQQSHTGAARTPGAAAQTRPLARQSSSGAGSARSAIARYATIWVNWTAATLPRQRAGLLALATGPLADELRQEAGEAVKARLQEVSQAYSGGRYVGVIPQRDGRAVVVTYEEAAPVGGQAQGAYHVYLTRTERTGKQWRLSEWQPATDS
jgi:hypothetical protein